MSDFDKENYKQKYLKYKTKYLQLKAQLGGAERCSSKTFANCALTMGCGWNIMNKKCIAKPCGDYSKLTCNTVPGCGYNQVYGQEKCEGCDRIGRCGGKDGCELVGRVCKRTQELP
jgi:hypothetical protein